MGSCPERSVPGHSGGGRAGFTPASLDRSVGATLPRATREVPGARYRMPDTGCLLTILFPVGDSGIWYPVSGA